MLSGVARRLKRGIDAGEDAFDVFNDCQDHMIATARAAVHVQVLEAFTAALERCEDAGLRALLERACDVYALAILAFELFTGQLPFTGKSAQETMIARLRGAPLPLRAVRGDLPVKLEAVITKALSVNPAERHGSMAELAHALEASTTTGVLGRLFRRSS